MAEAVNEGLLDKLKTAIRTSTAPAKARAAGDWFKEKVRQASASARMRAVTPNQLLRRQPEDDIMLGKMFFYKYDPKFAKKLPYWDMYPLVFPFERAKGGFYGINGILRRFGRAVPCVKRYLGDHVKSSTVRIDADEWEIAIFLPVERFQKESKKTVWADSRRYY